MKGKAWRADAMPHPQTDNPRQSSADYRSVPEDPARDAHELRLINLTRSLDRFYARFCVGPSLDQAHSCTASAPGRFRRSNIDGDSLSLAESADVRSFKLGGVDEHIFVAAVPRD